MITLNDLCRFATQHGISFDAPLEVSNLTTGRAVSGMLTHPDGKLRVCIEGELGGLPHEDIRRLCVAKCPEFHSLNFDAQTRVRDQVLAEGERPRG